MPDPRDPDFWVKEASLFNSELAELIMLALLAGTGAGINLLPPNLRTLIGWDFINQAAIDFLRTYQFEWIKDITETTRRQTVQAIEAWIESGDPISTLETRLIPIFGESRARSIAVTEVTRVFASGNMISWQSTGFVNAKKWQTAMDERVCPICGPLQGKIAGLEGSFMIGPRELTPELMRRYQQTGEAFTYMMPPAHVNCLPGDALITASSRISATSVRRYKGNMVVIRTASGNELSCTPNHPILSDGGWISAHLLNIGDNVVSHRRDKRILSFVNGNNIAMPSMIKEISDRFLSLSSTSSGRVPVAPEDFHGDGTGSKVAVIGANGFLDYNRKISFLEPFEKLSLKRRLEFTKSFVGLSSSKFFIPRYNSTSSRFMGGSVLGFPLIETPLAPFQKFGFSSSTRFNPRTEKSSTDSPSVDAIMLGKCVLGHTAEVFLDQIIDIQMHSFSGHVYNLQTEMGAYAANGIITHNCRCWLLPVVSVEGLREEIRAGLYA